MTTPTPQTFGEFRDELHSGNPGPTINEMYFAKLAWTASAQSSAARVRELEGELQRVKEPMLAKNQLCGCIVCTCEDNEENRCNGCGAKNCGNHPVGEFANPVYKPHSVLQSLTKQNSVLREVIEEALKAFPIEWISSGLIHGLKKALEATAPSEKGETL